MRAEIHQTALPHRFVTVRLTTVEDMARAISTMPPVWDWIAAIATPR